MPGSIGCLLKMIMCLPLICAFLASADSRVKSQTMVFYPEQLIKYPKIVFQGLSQAVMREDSKTVELLLPVYQRQTKQDPILIAWSLAILKKKNGDYKKSIYYYRRVISAHPQLELARLQLAITLFSNKENESALSQFNKLRANGNNVQLQKIINKYIAKIQSGERVYFTVGVNYLNENNINNAPPADKRIGRWRPEKRESGQGFSYYLSGKKNISLSDGFFSESRGMTFGKYYTNNHKYDELAVRFSSGIGYRDIDFSILALPFMEYNWISRSDEPSLSLSGSSFGFRQEIEYQLTNHWKTSSAIEVSQTDYRKSPWRDNRGFLLDNAVYYFLNSQEYFFIGGKYNMELAKTKRYGFTDNTVYGGWGREWNNGLSSFVQSSYSYKYYDGSDFFLIKQKSKQYAMLMSLWHRNIYFAGITPRVNFMYIRNDSNHPFYQYDKRNIFLTFSKLF